MAAVADQVIVEILARADQAKAQVASYSREFEQGMQQVERSAKRGELAVVDAGRRQGAAMQQASVQFGDFLTQVSLGGNVFTAFGAQAGQMAGALTNLNGRAGQVAAFFSGPFGAAIFAAVTVLGMMATKNTEAESAQRKHGEAARTLREAIDDLNDATGANVETTDAQIERTREAARAKLGEVIVERELKKAILDRILASSVPARTAGDVPNFGAAIAKDSFTASLKAEVDKANEDVEDAKKALRQALADTSLSDIEGRLDPARQARRDYENEIGRLRGLRERDAIDQREFDRRALDAALKRDAALEAASARARKPRQQTEKERLAALTPNERRLGYDLPPVDIPVELDFAAADEAIKGILAGVDQLKVNITDVSKVPIFDPEAELQARDLTRDLARSFADIVVYSDDWGDALVGSIKRAAAALIETNLVNLLNPSGGGGFGGLAGGLFSALLGAPGRQSGGNVTGGKLYRVNEGAGSRAEGFVPAGSGKIIPLGQMGNVRAASSSSQSVVQQISVDARGATDPAIVEAAARRGAAQALASGADSLRQLTRQRLRGGRG